MQVTIEQLYAIFCDFPSVQTDSRKIQKNDIFIALKGPYFNGNDYAIQSLEKGAKYALVDDISLVDHPYCLWVEDSLTSLQQLANHHRKQFNVPIIAITGSNGKTTTKELTASVLNQKYNTAATKGNLNNHIGVPLTILEWKKNTEIALVEMGANHLGEIASYCQISEPNYGLITNCGKAHLEGFGSEDNVKKAKGELYDYLKKNNGTIFRYTDAEYLHTMAICIDKQVTYGQSNAEIKGQILTVHPYLHIQCIVNNRSSYLIRTQLVGDYNLSNVLAAIAIGLYFQVNIQDIITAIENYRPENSRSQWLNKGGNSIVLDAYNANPTSMKSAIENFARIETPATSWVLLGAMKELGNDTQSEHQSIIILLERLGFKNVILVGEEYAFIKHHFFHYSTVKEAKDYLSKHPISSAKILIKGSRGAAMEQLLDVIH